MFPFERLLIADLSPSLDLDLLKYGAGVAALGDTSVTVSALPGDRVLRTLVPAVHSMFPDRREAEVSCRVLVEPDVEGLFKVASECRADLMLVRHPERWPNGRVLARRIVEESPCSIWMVPEGATPHLRRVAVEVGAVHADTQPLGLACALGRRANAEELVAIHVLTETPMSLERQDRQLFDLQCLMARMDVGDMACTVQVNDSPYVSRSLHRAAREGQADLLVTSSPSKNSTRWLRGWSEVDDLVKPMAAALLSVQFQGAPPRLRDRIGRFFSSPEPQFN